MINKCNKCGKTIPEGSKKCDACKRGFWNKAKKVVQPALAVAAIVVVKVGRRIIR